MLSLQKIPIKILSHGIDLGLPFYATQGSAGLDLLAATNKSVSVPMTSVATIPTGICIGLPKGYEGQVRPRSGLAAKYGVTVLNSPGTIDSDYNGEIKVILINLGKEDFVIDRGARIAQLVIKKYEQIEWNIVRDLPQTPRNQGGFGSTGI